MRTHLAVVVLAFTPLASITHAECLPTVDMEEAVISHLPELVLTDPLSIELIGATPGSLGLASRMDHYGVPGVSLAVIADDRVAWAEGYGVLDAETKTPVTVNALFEAASTTKFATAVAVWQLVQSGRLAFDDEANAHLTSWRIPENEFTATQKVTLRRLLSHTAGLNRPPGGFSYSGDVPPTLIQVLKGELPATNAPLAVETEPGRTHAYSNFGYIVFQQLLTEVLGRPYAEIMSDSVFSPLGMTHSGFNPATIGGGELPRARHHGSAGEAVLGGGQVNILSHGGLWTTPTDLAQLLLAVMHGYRGCGPLADCAPTIRQALQAEVRLHPPECFGFSGQGLGAFLLTTDHGMGITHPGQNDPGATCSLIGFLATGQGAIVMTNGAQGMLLSLELLSSVASAYGWPRVVGEPSEAGQAD